MAKILKGTVENLEETIERWLEYGLSVPIGHINAIRLTPVCVKALEEVNAYRLFTILELPDGITFTDVQTNTIKTSTFACQIVYKFNLLKWLKEGWNIEEYNAEQERIKNEIPNSE